MKKKYYIIAVVFSLFSLSLFSQDEEHKFNLLLTSGVDFTEYTLPGSAAWDKFYLTSMQALFSMVFPVEQSDKYSSVITVGFKRPVSARINQLDGVKNNLLPDLSAQFFGVYGFTGFLIPKTLDIGRIQISAGPSYDYFYKDGAFLMALSLEGKVRYIIPAGKRVITGLEMALGYDFWGLHNFGDTLRYDNSVKQGLGAQLNVFVGLEY